MVKLILPNSAPPGQESQKCLENKCTALVTSRLREVMKSDREVTKSDREVTKALVFGARWPKLCTYFGDIFGSPGQGGGGELGKMTFTIQFVYENYNF